jgi:hypothetical protein
MVRRHESLNGKDGGGHGETRQLAQQRTADGVRGGVVAVAGPMPDLPWQRCLTVWSSEP